MKLRFRKLQTSSETLTVEFGNRTETYGKDKFNELLTDGIEFTEDDLGSYDIKGIQLKTKVDGIDKIKSFKSGIEYYIEQKNDIYGLVYNEIGTTGSSVTIYSDKLPKRIVPVVQNDSITEMPVDAINIFYINGNYYTQDNGDLIISNYEYSEVNLNSSMNQYFVDLSQSSYLYNMLNSCWYKRESLLYAFVFDDNSAVLVDIKKINNQDSNEINFSIGKLLMFNYEKGIARSISLPTSDKTDTAKMTLVYNGTTYSQTSSLEDLSYSCSYSNGSSDSGTIKGFKFDFHNVENWLIFSIYPDSDVPNLRINTTYTNYLKITSGYSNISEAQLNCISSIKLEYV